MFPLRDENPTELAPFVTVAIIVANVVVWLTLQGMGSSQAFIDSLCSWGSIPGELTGAIPASIMLGYWFVLQVLSGTAAAGLEGAGIAFWAHVGGFVAGLALIKPFERRPLVDAKRAGRRLTPEERRDLGWF
jgi:membrane associated rhomboid family serine protease